MGRISALHANIAEQNTDVIVNAANTSLFGGSGVAGAIFDAAGYDKMTEACKKFGHCETGEAVITPGFGLPAKYVIHAVGPVYGQNNGTDAELLASCYYRALQLAEEKSLASISFPLISTGIYGFPKPEAINVAIDTVNGYFSDNPHSSITDVVFCAFSDKDKVLIESMLHNTFDRAEGMLVGLAIGDALGAPVEFGYSSDDIKRDWDGQMQDHRIPKGFYTDDTAMALCLADSLLACQGYNSYDVMTRYSRWASEGYRDSEGEPASDIGSQTNHAIVSFRQNPVIAKHAPRIASAGNGGIMRIAPVIIATAHQPVEDAMTLAKLSSRETHYSYEADASAEIFGAMLHRALTAIDKQQVIAVLDLSTGPVFDDIIRRVIKTIPRESEALLCDRGGYVVDAIAIAVWGFMNFDTFDDGIIAVIKLGGDTDTNAAIYGQLAGAFYGYSSISNQWQVDLYQEQDIKKIAGSLYKLKFCDVVETRFEEDGDDIFKDRSAKGINQND